MAVFLTSDAPLAARTALWPTLSSCDDARCVDVILHADAPESAAIDWYFERTAYSGSSNVTFDDRLVDVAIRLTATAGYTDVRKVGIVLGRMADPRAMDALFTIQDGETDAARKGKAFEDEVFKRLQEEGKDPQRDVRIP